MEAGTVINAGKGLVYTIVELGVGLTVIGVFIQGAKKGASALGLDIKTKTRRKIEDHGERIENLETGQKELVEENKQQTESLGELHGKMDTMIALARRNGNGQHG